METIRVDLKTLLGLALSKQYCHVIVRKNCGRFLGYIISWITPTPSMSLLCSTITLYDFYFIKETYSTKKQKFIFSDRFTVPMKNLEHLLDLLKKNVRTIRVLQK